MPRHQSAWQAGPTPGGTAISAPITDPQALMAPTRTSVLRHRQFALLFAGQALSLVGDRLFLVAMPFAVLSIPGAGAREVGLVLGASALSVAVFVLIGGVVADRLPRQLTMLASDGVRAGSQGLSAALLLSGQATVWDLVVLQAVYGASEAFFRPAMLGLVPQVVEPGEEQPANALLALSANASLVVAPAVGGLLVAALGAGGALAVDAGTFVLSALSLMLLRPRPSARTAGRTFLADLHGGWVEVRSRSWVWSTLLALRWKPSRPGVMIGATLWLASAQAAICSSTLPTWSVVALEAVTGVGVALCFTVWETLLQERIPAEAQSRVSSFDYLGSLTLMPVGYVVIGALAEHFGVRTTAVAASVITGVICLAIAASRGLRSLRQFPA